MDNDFTIKMQWTIILLFTNQPFQTQKKLTKP